MGRMWNFSGMWLQRGRWGRVGQAGAVWAGVSLIMVTCRPEDPGFGTPGTIDDTGEDSVIFTEIMANPDGGGKVQDKSGEWIELYNPGSTDVALNNWTITDSDGSTITLGELTIKAHGYLVLGSSNKNSENGGVSVDGTWDPDDLVLGNDSELVELKTPEEVVSDRLSWTYAPVGASISVDPTKYGAEENDLVGAVCQSQYSQLESGDYGTPGGLNDNCFFSVNPGDLVITEIMANPSAVADVEGEWIEVFNTTAEALRLDGFTVKDGFGDVHEVLSGGSLVVSARAYAVLGASTAKASNGNVEVDYAWGKSIILADDAGTISLTAGTTVIDSVSYGSTGFPTTPSGASLQLDRSAYSASGNDAGDVWCSSVDTISGGADKGTPGASNDTCVAATPTPSPTPTGP